MSETKTQHCSSIRQCSLQCILKFYDADTTRVSKSPQSHRKMIDIRRELTEVMKQSEQRNRKNERKRNGQHQNKGNNTHGRNTNCREQVIISRSSNNITEDAFKTFQKKCNLILNSMIDTNAEDVGQRLFTLFAHQTAIRATSESGTMDEKAIQFTDHVCQQIVDNASIQAIYSQVYVQMFKFFVNKLKSDGFGVVCAYTTEKLLRIVCDIDVAKVPKLNTKGIAKFTTYLHMSGQMDKETFHQRLTSWLSSRADNETNVCEAVVHTFLTLAKSKVQKVNWAPFVRANIKPLWEEGTMLGMRPRIRLWDIRDAYDLV